VKEAKSGTPIDADAAPIAADTEVVMEGLRVEVSL
jgi:hypothetical protein